MNKKFIKPKILIELQYEEVYKILKNRLESTHSCWMGIPDDDLRLAFQQYCLNEAYKLRRRVIKKYGSRTIGKVYRHELFGILLSRASAISDTIKSDGNIGGPTDKAEAYEAVRLHTDALNKYFNHTDEKQPWHS